MNPGEPSRTALIPARHRAAHQLLDHGAIVEDPFALPILGEAARDVRSFANSHPLISIGRLVSAARSRIAEDAGTQAVATGVRQIVILGAGLDTFALRHPHRAHHIRIYEVDHPATQAWKRQRLADAGLAPPRELVFAPVDFERDDLGEQLAAASFRRDAPAFFTWLGVAPYLTREAIDATLAYIASIPNAEVAFDYWEPSEAFSSDIRQSAAERSRQLEKSNEGLISRFDPAELVAVLRAHGFGDIEDTNYRELARRFGAAIQGLAPGEPGIHVVHAKR